MRVLTEFVFYLHVFKNERRQGIRELFPFNVVNSIFMYLFQLFIEALNLLKSIPEERGGETLKASGLCSNSEFRNPYVRTPELLSAFSAVQTPEHLKKPRFDFVFISSV